jgi:ribosomal protein S18 acetylase RimI-like enzyme
MSQLVMMRPPGAVLVPAGPGARLAAGADAGPLATLLGKAFPEMAWSEERVRAELLDVADVSHVFVVGESNAPLATASARRTERFPGHGYVHWVAVDPEARGRGLAAIVLVAVLGCFQEPEPLPVVLETDDLRLAGIAAYLALGFIPQPCAEDHAQRWSHVFMALAAHRRATKGRSS